MAMLLRREDLIVSCAQQTLFASVVVEENNCDIM